ncbi:zinc finger protein 59-like isoform X2 [Pectinophora gossypiella]|uniref:zinc finger protein 59-like isoform X2 n=1 Tax=Pectinophora gossypiella TaxID=13191 RepID=UPI00214E9833|nr:zinc finger protein 59-like isoform X2 [Pectinophora gossypiella]
MYEGSLCVCCMSTEDLVELFVTKTANNVEENYASMLAACLNVQLSETTGHDHICIICVSKLKDCVAFKKQVLRSISILTSADVTSLTSNEEISILGLNRVNETTSPIKEKINESQFRTERNEEPNVVINNIEVISLCNSIKDGFEQKKSNSKHEEDQPKLQAKVAKDKKKALMKRPVGRPRKRPQDTLPYSIAKDELTCRECGEVFPCNVTLKVHYNTHFGNHTCGECGKGFVTYSSLKKHETSHLEGPFQCDACGQEFRNINTLKSHVRYKHAHGPRYRCAACGARFLTAHRRQRHLADVHAQLRRYPCTYCHYTAATAAERSKHVAYNHEAKFYPCPVCGVRCRRQRLRAHIATHTGKADLKPRTVTKTEDRRFACRLCDKAFSQKVTLKYHIGTHVRKGEYHGDPGFLIIDRRHDGANDTGLLEDNLEEHLDESILSDDLKDVPHERVDIENVDRDDAKDMDGVVDEADIESDGYEIYTDVGFSLPSDFDD